MSLLEAASGVADGWCDGKISMPDKDGAISTAMTGSGPKSRQFAS
jgi:hypothetical protein